MFCDRTIGISVLLLVVVVGLKLDTKPKPVLECGTLRDNLDVSVSCAAEDENVKGYPSDLTPN